MVSIWLTTQTLLLLLQIVRSALNPYLFNTKAVSNSSYTRVGFVPAVQYGDTLFVLTGKYKGMTADQLKNEGIRGNQR